MLNREVLYLESMEQVRQQRFELEGEEIAVLHYCYWMMLMLSPVEDASHPSAHSPTHHPR